MTLNRQGPDIGTQYRSTILFYTPAQEVIAVQSKEALQKQLQTKNLPIATEIKLVSMFYPAEEYHQRYFEKNSNY